MPTSQLAWAFKSEELNMNGVANANRTTNSKVSLPERKDFFIAFELIVNVNF
jgi:hypothetical protein